MISAKVVADSKNEFGNRITTMVVTFPRIILAEFNTHRMFSRNSASSRAIPFEKMLEAVKTNPFIPIAWQKDHKGMQGTEYLNIDTKTKLWNPQLTDFESSDTIIDGWLQARDKAIEVAKALSESEVTKQLCNRLLEPFMYHTVIVTATEWENFFHLRCPQYKVGDLSTTGESGVGVEVKTYRSRKDVLKVYPHFKDQVSDMWWMKMNAGQAEIHAMALAEAMWDVYNESTPKELKAGEWHIPFGDKIDEEKLKAEISIPYSTVDKICAVSVDHAKIKVASARNARISYTVVGEEGKPDNYVNDVKLHDRLVASGHWSPMEHCAQAMSKKEYISHINGKVSIQQAGSHLKVYEVEDGYHHGWSGNFRGFIQYRKTFQNENVTN